MVGSVTRDTRLHIDLCSSFCPKVKGWLSLPACVSLTGLLLYKYGSKIKPCLTVKYLSKLKMPGVKSVSVNSHFRLIQSKTFIGMKHMECHIYSSSRQTMQFNILFYNFKILNYKLKPHYVLQCFQYKLPILFHWLTFIICRIQFKFITISRFNIV